MPAESSLSRRTLLKAGGLLLTGTLLPRGWSQTSGESGPVRLTLNENPFGPSPRAIEAIQGDLAGLFRYTTEARAAAVAEQLAKIEGVAPEQILLGEVLEPLGLHLSLHHGPGGEFVYSVPGYPALVNAAASVGGKVVSVPLNHALENDLPALEAAVGPQTAAVFLVNPHNPSGTASAAAAFDAFVRRVSERTLVIVDEAYSEYLDDHDDRTAARWVRAGANVLVFRTFAKVHGLAALPMGYAVAPREWAERLRARGLGFARGLNRLALAAASASAGDRSHVAHVRTAVAHERRLWHETLDRLRLRRTASVANFVYFDAGRPHDEVAAWLRAEGVKVGRMFPPYEHWIRITIGLPHENVRARAVIEKRLAP